MAVIGVARGEKLGEAERIVARRVKSEIFCEEDAGGMASSRGGGNKSTRKKNGALFYNLLDNGARAF